MATKLSISFDRLVAENNSLRNGFKLFVDYKTIVDRIVDKNHFNLDVDESEKYNELRHKVENIVREIDSYLVPEEPELSEDKGLRIEGMCSLSFRVTNL